MHPLSGRAGFGAFLSLVTVLLWGLLPIALKEVLVHMDPYTITFYRFLVSGLILATWLGAKGNLPQLGRLEGQGPWLLGVSIVGLLANYGFYLLALRHLDPRTAQTVIQLAPLLLLLGGVWLYKEPFGPSQLLGVLVLVLGLGLFFNERLVQIVTDFAGLGLGIFLMVIAAVTWAAYALAQKKLLRHFNSVQIMMLINLAGALVFLPMASPAQVLHLSTWEGGWLLFCCFNTLIAYGAFAEALNHWEASKVSALLATTPLFTFLFVAMLAPFLPFGFDTAQLPWLSYFGAALVVVGSVINALGNRLGWRRRR
ncbi:DMT family transporter [Gallaecimonas kandeliae]|uniref:DMT family transporter n=1 Tax=Gallaecimonas kandeliae TaxID=3029055 RepID=UPI002648969F|nr:DMT family transporter [Gallaecimonas kandeliae]WKE67159.1 DMT family transporter [Gallaecimonas kandeliae]